MRISLQFRNRFAAANLRRYTCASVVCALICLVWGGDAVAQYRYDAWTADSGLPQNIIRGITQDREGYLWVATLNGLARFDGIRFTVYDQSTSPGITSNRFDSLYP